MNSVEIAVDARVVATDARGIGRYERAILRRLLPENDLRFTLLVPGVIPALARRSLDRALASNRFALASGVPKNAGVVWHPANGTFFPSARPSVVTIHDAVPFRYPNADVQKRENEQGPFRVSVATAKRFIAVSQFGKREIEDVLGVTGERIEVIYHGVDTTFSPGEATLLPEGLTPGGYFLFVGNAQAEPRKNFPMLYEAYKRAWPEGDGPSIVIAGAAAPSLPGVVAAGEIGDDLRGNANAVLTSLYRGALALVIPSYHETFGMPLIEAMACGAPAIASDASCLPEIGAGAARYAPPDDEEAWAQALREIASEPELRTRLREAGIERARAFDWETSARAHHELFARVAMGAA